MYEREVAPRLAEVRTVICNRMSGMEAVGVTESPRSPFDPLEAARGRAGAGVPADETRSVRPTRAYLPSELRKGDRDLEEHLRNKWLLGCWDAVLLPRCARWVRRATIDFHLPDCAYVVLVRDLPDIACLRYTLERTPSVAHLSLGYQEDVWCEPADAPRLTLSDLVDALPGLASLHVSSMMRSELLIFELLTTDRCTLQQLYLDCAIAWEHSISFRYPRHCLWPPAEGYGSRKAARRTLKLRRELSAYMGKEARVALSRNRPAQNDGLWLRILDDCKKKAQDRTERSIGRLGKGEGGGGGGRRHRQRAGGGQRFWSEEGGADDREGMKRDGNEQWHRSP